MPLRSGRRYRARKQGPSFLGNRGTWWNESFSVNILTFLQPLTLPDPRYQLEAFSFFLFCWLLFLSPLLYSFPTLLIHYILLALLSSYCMFPPFLHFTHPFFLSLLNVFFLLILPLSSFSL
jgi:hypothetical protein